NLGVGFTDSPVTSPTATGTSSNVAFPFGPIPMALDFPLSPGGASFGASFNLTPAQFSSITGTYTFHVCDTNGCVNDTTHNLDHPEVLLFPTNLAFSNQTTMPLFTMTDPNGAAGAGLIR